MSMSKTRLFRDVIKAALSFYELQPWKPCVGGHAFALRLSGETYP